MSEFKADIRDLKFTLFEQLKVQEMAETERYQELDRELLETVIDEAYKFAVEVIAPTNEIGDKTGCRFEAGKVYMPEQFRQVLKMWGENGWASLSENPQWGGQGLPLVMTSAVDEIFIGANCALALTPMLTVGAAHLIEQFAQDWLKNVCLEKLYSLQWTGTMCLTEPQAGSDVGASKTKAIPQPDGTYKIIGTKNFITGGDHQLTDNIIHMVLARTPDAAPGTRGLSLFVVPKYRLSRDGATHEFNDVICTGIEEKLGIHGSATCTLNFGDNEGCLGYLIGEEQKGLRLMFHLMNEARIWVGMQGLGLGAAAYQQALQYAKERLQGSDLKHFKDPTAPRVPIIRHPDVKRMLMTMKAWTEAMRSMFLTVAYYQDMVRVADRDDEKAYYQGLVDLFTPICKAYGSDTGFEVASMALQVLGGYGYCKEFPLEQYLRDVRIAAIYEGTNGIQAMDLFSRKVPMKGGVLFKNYVGEIKKFLQQNRNKHQCISDLMDLLDSYTQILATTTSKLGEIASKDLGLGLLQAYPYLKMFGHVACAFELIKQAVVAHDALSKIYKEKGITDSVEKQKLYNTHHATHFYRNKIYTTRFFFNAILPEVECLSERVLSRDSSALECVIDLD